MRWPKIIPPLRWALNHVWRHAKLPLIIAAVMNIFYAIVPASTAYVIGKLVGCFNTGSITWSSVYPWLCLLLLVHLIGQIFILNSLKEYLYQRRLEKSLDEMIVQKIAGLPLYYFENNHFYDLISRTINPSKRVQAIIEDIFNALSSWLKIILLLVVIGANFWWMVPVLLVVTYFSSQYESTLGKRLREYERKVNILLREKEYASQLLTSKHSVMEIKIFQLQHELLKRWKSWFSQLHYSRIKFDLSLFIPEIPLSGVKALLLFASIALLAWHTKSTGGELATLSAALIALISFFQEVDSVGSNARSIGEGAAYLEEVLELVNLDEMDNPSKSSKETLRSEQNSIHTIEFQNVTFTYPGEDKPVLRNISLRILPFESVALVGANGSGKSTLVKLLLGLYQPDEGHIFINGKDITEWDSIELHNMMSVVFQDFSRYSLTAAENIGLGNVEAIEDVEQIQRAASLGGADSFIAGYAMQYNTPLGKIQPNSIEPSGGQWQKIAISRALMRPSPIMIFDEPSASLDPLAEAELYHQIGSILENKTAILVTHRLGSIKTCDKILVLHNGEIVEEGTHPYLVSTGNVYKNMYETQAKWYTEDVS
jgi:ATP-binding cassette, subfamily B, bacterial